MNQWCLLIFLEKYYCLLCVLCFTWGSAVYLRVTKHDFNQLFQQIKQIPLASIKQIKKKIQTMFKILLRDYTWTICTICGDHWAKKKHRVQFSALFQNNRSGKWSIICPSGCQVTAWVMSQNMFGKSEAVLRRAVGFFVCF